MTSETITENIFRGFYGSNTFLEKSAIRGEFGFISKKNPNSKNKGYPDFLKEQDDYIIVVEAKATKQEQAIEEVKHYVQNNEITKDIVGIAVSGQSEDDLKVDYFLKQHNSDSCTSLYFGDSFLSLDSIAKLYKNKRYGSSTTNEELILTLKSLNKTFNDNNKVRDTDRSLFFSGLMIALKDRTFRDTYRNIHPPTVDETKSKNQSTTVLSANNLNNSILEAITRQLVDKINNLSKEYSWKDRFSFIKNIDYDILEYKEIIKKIEENIFVPFQKDEKQDILSRAYRVFLSKAGKIDNKNIILTPDHIKVLMTKLARLSKNDVVLDTCTGTGGFLMEAMEEMISKANNDEKSIINIKEKQLIGFESDSVLFALACSNMFLHGDGRSNLLFRSSLLKKEDSNVINNKEATLLKYIKSLKPTKCIINPPYENNNSIEFAIQAVEYLESNGKLIIIMPTPTLTKNQTASTKTLLKVAKLDFVIKMPFNLFTEQGRTVNTSIFGFTKTPHDKKDDVLYFKLESDGLVSIQHKGRLDTQNKWKGIQNKILDTIQNSKEIKGICTKKRIYNKDGSLNCAGVQNLSKSNTTLVKIGDLFILEKGSLASEKNEGRGFHFITGAKEWKTHAEYTHDTEALVYVTNASGSLGRCHYVKGKFIVSNLCYILKPKNQKEYPVNLRFYQTLLNRKKISIVSDLADGTSKLTIGKTHLEGHYIEYFDIKKQDVFVQDYVEKYIKDKDRFKKIIIKSRDAISDNLDKIL
jgi:tRNA1(Val) A37 N6-methylase TrmN6